MPRIEWTADFSVSSQEIDEQHKKWIEIINELHDTLMHGQPEDLSRITGQTFRAMEDYVRMHFAFEEEYMGGIGYPELAAHRQEHRDFMERLSRYRQDFDSGKMTLNSDIMKILTNWLQSHILESDKKYASFAANRPAG